MTQPKPRPSQRQHTTYGFHVGGNKVHMSVGLYPDGAPMELWLDIHKQGSDTRGMLDAIARLVSRSWQHHVSALDIIDQFVNTKFGTPGMGSGHPAIEGVLCGSLLDAVGRVLDHELNGGNYVKEQQL